MTCRDLMANVTAYMDGALAPQDRERFEAHRGACPGCRLHVAQWQTMVGSLGRLEDRGKGAAGTQRDHLLALFRERGLHRAGPRVPGIPLGLATALVAPGDHLAYFWETDEEFVTTAGFVAAGVQHGETSLLLGHAEAHARLATAMSEIGLDVAALQREQRLRFLADRASADGLINELGEQVKSALDRGTPRVRVLGNLGWGRMDSAGDRELLRLEAGVTEAIRMLPVVVACCYEVRRVPGLVLLLGGLECHPLVCRRGTLRHNELFAPRESVLSDLEKQPALFGDPDDGSGEPRE